MASAATALSADATPDTRAVMALQMKIEDATVRGDVAFVTDATSPDFTMVHGDHWTTGRMAQLADDKAGYLKRVSEQSYLIHDVDPASIHFEMHKDVAIVYGRYLSVGRPRAGTKAPGTMSSIWFERVFQKRGGEWVYLSHRTVHGPILSPAAIDPTSIPWNANPEAAANIPLHPAVDPVGSRETGVPADQDPTISKSPEAAEVTAFEQAQEAAVVNGDVAFLQKALADDFLLVHDDRWIRGGKPTLVDDKESFLKRAAARYYHARDLDSVRVETHGDVAITYGRCVAHVNAGARASSDKTWSSTWYERVFEKENGRWQLLSDRAVAGPSYASTRELVTGK